MNAWGCERVAVVTGAAGAIGRATVLRLRLEGAHVIGLDRDPSVLEIRTTDSEHVGPYEGITLNCADEDSVRDVLADVQSRCQGVDILVNTVGTSGADQADEFWRQDVRVLREVLDTSLVSAMVCAKQVVPGMRSRGWGRVIGISSGAWVRPWKGITGYAAAKAGLVGFSRALALELAPHGVTVNLVSPGPIRTPAFLRMPQEQQQQNLTDIPMKRLGEPHEIAAAVAFLTRDEAAFITGQNLGVNGGRVFF